MKSKQTTLNRPALAANGFSYAKIETAKTQRVKRVIAEIESCGSIGIGKIRKVCGYTQNNNALFLATGFVTAYPDKFYLHPVPKRLEVRFKEEIESGKMRVKHFKTEPIRLVMYKS